MESPIRNDRTVGHVWANLLDRNLAQFDQDELEFGARVALEFQDPMQCYWALYEEELWPELQGQ